MAVRGQAEADIETHMWFDSANFRRHAGESGSLLLQLRSAPADARGQLHVFLSEEIEQRLQRAGASPRPSCQQLARNDMLGDQLYRARLLGCHGLAIAFGSFDAIAQDGVLHAQDSETLRWWMKESEGSDLTLLFPEAAAALKGYSEPVPLTELLEVQPALVSDGSPRRKIPPAGTGHSDYRVVEEQTATETSHELSSGGNEHSNVSRTSQATTTTEEKTTRQSTVSHDNHKGSSFRDAMRQALCGPNEDELEDDDSFFAHRAAPTLGASSTLPLSGSSRSNPSNTARNSDAIVAKQPRSTLASQDLSPPEPPSAQAPPSDDDELAHSPSRAMTPSSSWPLSDGLDSKTTEVDVDVSESGNQDYEQHLLALQNASGEQSWNSLETLYTEAFAPLQQAWMAGTAGEHAQLALEEWSQTFSSSYVAAFERLKTRGRRPNMVFDAPNLAFRLARRISAKQLRLIIVDSLRFDIAEAVQSKLELQLSGCAELVQKGMLWSALPCTSAVQLELLAKGAEGLRTLGGTIDEAAITSPVHEARRLRPLRVGPHHLFKLDAIRVESDRTMQPCDIQKAAAEVAVSVGRFLRQQAPGTLAFVFGDRGFSALPNDTGAACPERVLVPFQAWWVQSPDTPTSKT